VRVVNSRESDLLTLAEAAAYLRVHRRTMARLLRQGVVPGTKIGRQWRVRVADLDAVLASGATREPSAKGTEHAADRADGSSPTE
jgi:excisionase family DNA binding protein